MMSLKTHSTDTLTLLMALFQSISFWVSLAPLKGLCNCGRWGYAGSPYKHNGSPFVALEYNTSWLYKLDSASIELSCRFPSTGQYKLANRQFGTETDWNFMACTFLCPLYSTLWFLPSRETGLTVPSTNPKQFCKAPSSLKSSINSECLQIIRRKPRLI